MRRRAYIGPGRFVGDAYYAEGLTGRLSPGAGNVAVIVLLGSMDITDPANQASFSRAVAAGYTGATGSAFAYEADVDVLRDAHHAGGSTGVLLEDSPTACALPAPANVSFGPNGINLNVDGSWDEVIGSVDHYEYRYDGAGSWTEVVPTGPTFATNELHTTGTAGTHTVDIRAVSPSGVAGAGGTSGTVVLVGASGFDPAADANVVEWLRADEAGNTTTNWNKLVGSDATGTSTLPSNVQNGKPAYLFNGTSQNMLTGTLGTIAQPFEIFLAYKSVGSDDTGVWALFTDAGATAAVFANGGMKQTAGSPQAIYSLDTSFHIVMFRFDGASSGYQLDGGAFVTLGSSAGTNSWSGIASLADYAAFGFYWNGYIGEFGVRQGASDSDTLTAIFSYLNDRWATF